MEFLRCTMPAFAVLGKEDSTQNKNKDWIQRLWKDFNEHSAEISQLALRDEQGNLAGIWHPGKAAQSTDFLGSNDIILLHETVPFRKNGKDITIELYAQQYNHHAEEIGEEKACQLSDTDVLAEKFPNKSVHISHIYN